MGGFPVNSPKLTIIGGTNGSGKSSAAGIIRNVVANFGMVVDPDEIRKRHRCGPVEAGKLALRFINQKIDERISFAEETTLSGMTILRTAKKAKQAGFNITLFYFSINDLNELKRRIRNRVKNGGHAVSDEDVERRFRKRYQDVCRVLPYCDDAIFFDNQNGFVKVAEYETGTIVSIGEYSPTWIRELMQVSISHP